MEETPKSFKGSHVTNQTVRDNSICQVTKLQKLFDENESSTLQTAAKLLEKCLFNILKTQ